MKAYRNKITFSSRSTKNKLPLTGSRWVRTLWWQLSFERLMQPKDKEKSDRAHQYPEYGVARIRMISALETLCSYSFIEMSFFHSGASPKAFQ